jgi:tripartite-type tricarboxylate transporter receptor subunit TctC
LAKRVGQIFAASRPRAQWLMGGNSPLVINPSLYETLPFDPIKDFAPISQVFIAANVLAVPTELPVKSVAELVALARAQPGKLSYGHAGVGTFRVRARPREPCPTPAGRLRSPSRARRCRRRWSPPCR